MATSVAVAACADLGGLPDLYPDPDWPLVAAAFDALGCRTARLAWDDPSVDWAAFDVVLIRSTWDSVDRPDEYLAWCRSVPHLLNPAPVVEWNLDKRHLAGVADAVPTRWVEPGSPWEPPDGEFVVKPSISAGARETARYGPGDVEAARGHVERIHGAGRTAMVQAFLPAVEDPGELKLVFLGGDFSHAVRYGPQLEPGAGVMERPWERPIAAVLDEPSPEELAVARRALAGLGDLAYARVDLVDGLVLEIEVIDPNLGLSLAPASAERLASAVIAASAGGTPAATRPSG